MKKCNLSQEIKPSYRFQVVWSREKSKRRRGRTRRTIMTTKTIVNVDMVAYQRIEEAVEQSLGTAGVVTLNKQVQGFVSSAVKASGGEAIKFFEKNLGDGALIGFTLPVLAVLFASNLHEISRTHNFERTEPTAKRVF